MNYKIVPIAEPYIHGFWTALDYVAKEKKYLAFFEAPPFESTAKFVRENIQKDHAQFVALSDQDVVGWCDIMPLADRPIHKHIGVLGIGLLPKVRGQGLGLSLMQQTIEKAKTKGFTRIELTVRMGNENAIMLYKKLGFDPEGVKRRAACIDGAYEDVMMMALIV